MGCVCGGGGCGCVCVCVWRGGEGKVGVRMREGRANVVLFSSSFLIYFFLTQALTFLYSTMSDLTFQMDCIDIF